MVKDKTEPIANQPTDKRTLSYKEQLEYQQLELEIAELEDEIASLTENLSNTQDHVELQDIAKSIDESKDILEQKTDRWLVLAEYY